MRRYIKLITVAFCFALLTGINAYAGKSIDGPGNTNGTSNLVVIKGKIRSIDFYKMEIILDGCALLGTKPLKLSGETSYYLESEEGNFNSVRGGTRFTENDRISFYELEVGHTIKCNYEFKDGEFWAVRVIKVFSQVQQILF